METRDLQCVKRRFERWRRSRGGAGRIPNELWKVAAEMGAVHGIAMTAAELGIDPDRLREWMPPEPEQPTAADGEPLFVELPPWSGDAAECTLDIEDAAGRKLRISLKGSATTQAVDLARLFWKEPTS